MPLPEPTARREVLHRRTVEFVGYRREDGLFDIEAHLLDRKDIPFPWAGALHQPGEPVHAMWLRITIDRELRVVDAAASTEAMPYPGVCDRITGEYRKLVGLTLGPGYLRHLRDRLGGVHGCTHLSELAAGLATAAFQTAAGQGLFPPERKPPQLDRCHALDTHGEVVARFHPRWYRGPASAPANAATNAPDGPPAGDD